MAKIIGLPKLSPTMEEGTLVEWVKSEGDDVDVDDLLAEVETDKATMEFRSFDRGVLLKILVPAGETLAPDVPVAIIGERGEDIADLVAEAERLTKTGGGGDADAAEAKGADPERQTVVAEPAPDGGSDDASAEEPRGGGRAAAADAPTSDRILASPLVRKVAREKDVDLAKVTPTGPRGRIIKRDLDAYLSQQEATPSARAAGERPAPTVEKASQMRKTIARRLTESKQQVPHFYLTIDVDAEPIWQARKAINAELADDGEKVSLNDLIIKACAAALRRVPDVNRSWIDGEIHTHHVVDISVAVAIPDGLVTPVVRDADHKGVLAISREVRQLAERARAKKLRPEEFQNGTFSISNLGMYGIEEFAAVINPPEGALLAVGTVREVPVVKDGAVVPGRRMRLTLSCDHRVVDGAIGAQYCAALKRLLERPTTLLI